MELITVDDKYDEKTLSVFLKHEIRYPKQDQIVEMLRIEKYTNGKIGLIVAPFQEQYITDNGFSKEVSYSKERFTTLLGDILTDEMLDEEYQNQRKQEKVLVKTQKLDKNNPYNN